MENYLHNLVKNEKKEPGKAYALPEELDSLLDGIEVNEQLQTIEYKSLRDEMYAKRPI